MEKIICFGLRNYEEEYFIKLGKKYNYDLILKEPFLTNENYELALNYRVVMVRGNCFLNEESLKKLKEGGLVYLLTRTVGYNHIDIEACKKLGINVANVPAYSPNAVAELAVTLAMTLLRNVTYTTNKLDNLDFRVDKNMFSREIRNCTVGILGCGRIGYTTAKLYKGLGAKVIGYDLFINENYKDVVEFVDLEYLIKNSDIISVHMPFKDNRNFINKEFIEQMKQSSILVNTARGELVDVEALVEALENNKIFGAALDVIDNERALFFKKHDSLDGIYERMHNLYPKLLLTPHIGSATDEALTNMIEISLQNLDEYLKTNECKNKVV